MIFLMNINDDIKKNVCYFISLGFHVKMQSWWITDAYTRARWNISDLIVRSGKSLSNKSLKMYYGHKHRLMQISQRII